MGEKRYLIALSESTLFEDPLYTDFAQCDYFLKPKIVLLQGLAVGHCDGGPPVNELGSTKCTEKSGQKKVGPGHLKVNKQK